MRHRDQPTVEVAQRLCCDIDTAWRCVTDIALPARVSTELVGVEWLDGADHVAVGARFRAAIAAMRWVSGRQSARSLKLSPAGDGCGMSSTRAPS